MEPVAAVERAGVDAAVCVARVGILEAERRGIGLVGYGKEALVGGLAPVGADVFARCLVLEVEHGVARNGVE